MFQMGRAAIGLLCLVSAIVLFGANEIPQAQRYPWYSFEAAREHEIKPRRRIFHTKGVDYGSRYLRLRLTISPTGEVLDARAGGRPEALQFWPQFRDEVRRWRFKPFEKNGRPLTVQVEDYIDLVPSERLPAIHAPAPAIHPNSEITISLERTGCFGTCPSYTVIASTNGIVFDGRAFVVAPGRHTDTVEPADLRKLANRFTDSNFYSMESHYRASVSDSPTYSLCISIDGKTKRVSDYVGEWLGMPAVITELEDAVDAFARTQRWINGDDGLIQALQAEKFNFQSFEAQVMLKEAANRGKAATVRQFLQAGVPLTPLPPPKLKTPVNDTVIGSVGWLAAASSHPEVLQVLIGAGASKNDQSDKDWALAGAARSGKLHGVRALIAYGANPNADFSKLILKETGTMPAQRPGAGSVLIDAAESGNPAVVREILNYKPDLEIRDNRGRTALLAAANDRERDKDASRVQCVRLLAEAGADVNARDDDGNTPLHTTFLTDVKEELLRLGADVNARNSKGETPIFGIYDDGEISLLIRHGADLTIRNNKGETVIEAARRHGAVRRQALIKAIWKSQRR